MAALRGFVADADADRLADNPAAAFRAVEEAVLRGFDVALPIAAPSGDATDALP
jgi:hypothetical protein